MQATYGVGARTAQCVYVVRDISISDLFLCFYVGVSFLEQDFLALGIKV